MLHYVYGAAIGLISVVAIALSSWLLHRLDLLVPTHGSVPWWHTWKRMVLVAGCAFIFGFIGILSTQFLIAGLGLVILSFGILATVYKLAGIGVWSYRLEQLALWPAWASATVIFGGPLGDVLWLAPLGMIVCGVLGSIIMADETATAVDQGPERN